MDRSSRIVPRWLDGLTIALAAALMLAWTWRTWPDPLVDFGRELYVPWQIDLGQVLYRDIAYFNGPLSPYLNAAWMWLFGVSLNTLIAANLVVIGSVLTMLYLLLNLAADRLTAVVACLFFVGVFGFGRVVAIGSQNFVSPYSHEITHGVALSLGALACLYLPRRMRIINVAGAGLLTGMVLLTKVEVALACVAAVVAGFILRVAIEPSRDRRRLAVVLFVATATPVVLAFLLLCLRLPAHTALEGTLGSFFWAVKSKVASSAFYRLQMGLDHFGFNLGQIALSTALLFAFALWAVGVGFVAKRIALPRNRWISPVIAFLVTAGAGLLTLRSTLWFNTVPKALPLVMIVLLGIWGARYFAEFRSPEKARVLGLRFSLSLFGLALLAKILFYTRLYHYGFALAMPAMLLLLAAFLCWGANFAGSRFADAGVVKSIGLAMTAVMVVVYLTAVSTALRKVHNPVGFGSDLFFGDGRGAATQATVQWLRQNTPPNSSVVVLPEGVMINYLARRSNPTTYVNFMPPEVIMFGEDHIVAGLNAHPPDFIVLCHKDTSEYGAPLFAHDYGQNIARWVHDNYEAMVLLGDPPFVEVDHFGILILRRRSVAGAPSTHVSATPAR